MNEDDRADAMSAMEDYQGRVQAILWRAAELLPDVETSHAQHLADHGEPAEGMCSLAWAIVSAGIRVPMSLIRDVQDCAGLVPEEFMPPDFESFGMPGE